MSDTISGGQEITFHARARILTTTWDGDIAVETSNDGTNFIYA